MEIDFSIFQVILISLCPAALLIASLIALEANGILQGRGSIAVFSTVLLLAVTLGTPIFFDVVEGALNVQEGKGVSLALFSVNRVIFVVTLLVAVVRAGSLVVELPIRWYLGTKENEWISPLRVLAALLIATLSFDLVGAFLSSELNPTSLLKAFNG